MKQAVAALAMIWTAAVFGQEPGTTTHATDPCIAYHLTLGIDGNRRTARIPSQDSEVLDDAIPPKKRMVILTER